MNKFVLIASVAMMTFCLAGESWAESWNCGPEQNGEYSDSVICTYDEQSKTLIIEGEGNMGNYPNKVDNPKITPWTTKEILHAVIKGNVTSIGTRVFKNVSSLQDISGTESINLIEYAAFSGASSLKGIYLPNVEQIGGVAFHNAINLEYAWIPSNVTFGTDPMGRKVFEGTKIPECSTTGKCCNGYIKRGVGCVKDCGENFRPNDGECDRLRYTPAEAAEVLRNDNTNEVTITFKK